MNLFSLYATLSLDDKDYKNKIKQAQGDAEQAASGISKSFSAIKSGITTAAKVGAAAVGAAATAIGTLSVAAINSYAEYEQLVGGVETLFKESAKQVEAYADAAYQTAGMSANEYMNTVTSFSATLLQGLGNDTQKAAEYGDKAVVQMADNANKMGTSIESIQYAYQGFAKQNYTMLDNLKLGYGGTQAEMARLINDSGVLGDTMEVTAETVNQVSFATIIDAIGVVQDRLGITGTTAKEAASTIQGSVSSMKAAWSNLMTALTAEDWDVGVYVENFTESVKTVIDNIAPRLTEVLPNITTAIGDIFAQLSPYLLTTMQTLLPQLISGAITLVSGLASQIPSIIGVLVDAINVALDGILEQLPSFAESISQSFESFPESIEQILPSIVSTGGKILQALYDGIMQAIPALANSASSLMSSLGAYLSENMPTLMQKGLEAVKNLTSSLRENAGIIVDGAISLALSLAKGLADSIPTIVENVPTIVSNIANVINDNAPKIFAAAVQIIITLVSGLIKSIPTIVANIPQIIKAIVDVIMAFNWINLGSSIIRGIANGIKNLAGSFRGTMSGTFKEAAQAAMDAIKGFPSKAIQWGKDMISGFVKGITSSIGNIVRAVSSVASTVSNYLHFSVPDKGPLREYESWMPDMMQGLAKGIDNNLWRIEDAAKNVSGALAQSVSPVSVTGTGAAFTGASYGPVNITVNAAPGQSARQIAQEVAVLLEKQKERRAASLA